LHSSSVDRWLWQFPFSTNVKVPPNQFELSDCQEIILNNTYIWDLPASPVAFGLLWCISTFRFRSTGPLSVTNHMATQKKPQVPALHVALVHFQLYSTLWAVETRRSLSISSHFPNKFQVFHQVPLATVASCQRRWVNRCQIHEAAPVSSSGQCQASGRI
jgi:hypothetical protein